VAMPLPRTRILALLGAIVLLVSSYAMAFGAPGIDDGWFNPTDDDSTPESDPLVVPTNHDDITVPGILAPCEGLGLNLNLRGTIVSADEGEPLDNITVTAVIRSSTAILGRIATTTVTNEAGEYEMLLFEGTYTLIVSDEHSEDDEGYRPEMREDVEVRCFGGPTVEDFELEARGSTDVAAGVGTIHVKGFEVIPGLVGSDNPDHRRPLPPQVRIQVSLPFPYHPVQEDLPLPDELPVDCEDLFFPKIPAAVAVPQHQFVSNETGEATFSNRLPAKYCARVGHDDIRNPSTTNQDVDIRPIWEPVAKKDIIVEADETTTVELETYKVNSRTLRTVVFGITGAREEGATVTIHHDFYCPGGETPEGALYTCEQVTNNIGMVNFQNLPWVGDSEPYRVVITKDGYEPLEVETTLGTFAGGTLQIRNIRGFAPLTEVAGTIDRQVDGTIIASGFSLDDSDGVLTWSNQYEIPITNGAFSALIPPSDFHLRIETDDGGTYYRCINVDPLSDPFSFELGAPGSSDPIITGRLVEALADTPIPAFANTTFVRTDGGGACLAQALSEEWGGDGTGEFEIGLGPGEYEIVTRHRDRPKEVHEPFNVTTEDKDVGEVGLDWLRRNINGFARLSIAFGADVPGASSPFIHEPAQGAPIECTSQTGMKVTTETTDSTGNNLNLALPRPGVWTCEILEGEYFGQSAGTLEVPSSGNMGSIELLLERRIWNINGNVTDAVTGDPIAGAEVRWASAHDDDAEAVLQFAGRTGDDGAFEFEVDLQDIAPGIEGDQIAIVVLRGGYAPAIHPLTIGASPGATNHAPVVMVRESIPSLPGIPEVGDLDDPEQAAINAFCETLNGTIDGCTEDTDGNWTYEPEIGGVPDLPDPNELIPDELDPTNPNDVFGAIGMNEELNCDNHSSWTGWLNQVIGDPECQHT
jgi:hypothetical protein